MTRTLGSHKCAFINIIDINVNCETKNGKLLLLPVTVDICVVDEHFYNTIRTNIKTLNITPCIYVFKTVIKALIVLDL